MLVAWEERESERHSKGQGTWSAAHAAGHPAAAAERDGRLAAGLPYVPENPLLH